MLEKTLVWGMAETAKFGRRLLEINIILQKIIFNEYNSIVNQLLLERYKQLVNERYVEPKEEGIIGNFLHMRDITDFAVEVIQADLHFRLVISPAFRRLEKLYLVGGEKLNLAVST